MDLHNLDNVVQLNWVTGLPDVQRIILGTSKHDIDFAKIFFGILERKGIEYTFEKNEGSQKLLVKIGDYTCIIRSLDTEHAKTKIAFIEGWIPEHELLTPHNKWKVNKYISKEELTILKNRALNAINDAYGLCASEWEGEEPVEKNQEIEETSVEDSIDLKSSVILDRTFQIERILLSSGTKFQKRVLDRFIKYLTINNIPFSYEEYHHNKKWIFHINGYSCMLLRDKKNTYLEGWVSEFESFSYVYGHMMSSSMTPEGLKMLKDNIIAAIRTEFNLQNCANIGLYDDNTRMPIGFSKGKKLSELKAEALLKYSNENAQNIDFDLYLYVQENLSRIQGQYRMEQKELHNRYLFNQGIVTFKCAKKTFATRKLAMEAIVKIPRKTKDGEEKKRPIRAYECRHCSGWHLTSKTVEEYKENVERFNQQNNEPEAGAEELVGISDTID